MDKLLRAVFDGLTGIAYNDDGQVVAVTACKLYAEKGHPGGAFISISEVADVSELVRI